MNIDTSAPAIAREEIVVNAPIEKVWALQSDINHWADWQPDVSKATLDGGLEVGKIFRWKAAGLAITSTLQIVEPYTQLGWTGDSIGMKAIHIWHFEATNNRTRVRVEESLSGWLTRLMCLFDRNFLQKSMAKSLAILKNQAEKSI